MTTNDDYMKDYLDYLARRLSRTRNGEEIRAIVDISRRGLVSEIVSAGFARVVTAVREAAKSTSDDLADGMGVKLLKTRDEIKAMFKNADGDVAYKLTLKPEKGPSGASAMSVELSHIPEREVDNRIGRGVLVMRASGSRYRFSVRESDLSDFFAFTAGAMQTRAFGSAPVDAVYGDSFGHWEGEIDDLLDGDGGLPGERCKALLYEQMNLVMGAICRVSLPAFMKEAKLLTEKGFVWGESYLAHSDTDIRCCAVPVPNGMAVFHENIDLIYDESAFVALGENGENGFIKEFRLYPLDRYRDSPSALVAALVSGTDVPDAALVYDVTTKRIVKNEMATPEIMSNCMVGLFEHDLKMARRFNPERKIGDMAARTDFSVFEPEGYSPDEEAEVLAP